MIYSAYPDGLHLDNLLSYQDVVPTSGEASLFLMLDHPIFIVIYPNYKAILKLTSICEKVRNQSYLFHGTNRRGEKKKDNRSYINKNPTNFPKCKEF